MRAIIYSAPCCREVHKQIARAILSAEGIEVIEKVVPVSELIRKSKSKVAYSWCVEFNEFDTIASSSKELYELIGIYRN